MGRSSPSLMSWPDSRSRHRRSSASEESNSRIFPKILSGFLLFAFAGLRSRQKRDGFLPNILRRGQPALQGVVAVFHSLWSFVVLNTNASPVGSVASVGHNAFDFIMATHMNLNITPRLSSAEVCHPTENQFQVELLSLIKKGL